MHDIKYSLCIYFSISVEKCFLILLFNRTNHFPTYLSLLRHLTLAPFFPLKGHFTFNIVLMVSLSIYTHFVRIYY